MNYLVYAIYGAVALIASLSVVLALATTLHIGTKIKREPIAWILPLCILVIMIGPLASGRNLSGLTLGFDGNIETLAASLWVNRLVNGAVLLLVAEKVLRTLFKKEWSQIESPAVFFAFSFFVLTNSIVNSIWGSVTSFSHQSIYMLIGVLGVYLISSRLTIDRILRIVTSSVLFLLVASFCVLLIKPSLVLESGYRNGVFPYRYWGLGTHANTVGPLIVCGMLCLWAKPYASKYINASSWLVLVASLVATQSKTSIIAGVISLIFLITYKRREFLKTCFRTPAGRGVSAAILFGFLLVVSASFIFQLTNGIPEAISELFRTRAGQQIATFTNRDLIWGYAIGEWRLNPMFGYGPSIFDTSYRMQIGLPQAFHGHNQLMHTLGAAGYVGVLGLLVFLCVLVHKSIRTLESSGGLSVALVLFMFVRGVTEVPLFLIGVGNVEFFFLATTVAVLTAFRSPTKGLKVNGKVIQEGLVSFDLKHKTA